MYITLAAGAPWEKIVSARLKFWTFLATPAESRKTCALNAAFLPAILFDVLLLGLITSFILPPAYGAGVKATNRSENLPSSRDWSSMVSRRVTIVVALETVNRNSPGGARRVPLGARLACGRVRILDRLGK